MCLHEDTHDFSDANLKLVLKLNFVLEYGLVVFFGIFLIFFLIDFLHQFSAFLNASERFIDHSDGSNRKFSDFLLGVKAISSLINDVFHSGELVLHNLSACLFFSSHVNSICELLRDSE